MSAGPSECKIQHDSALWPWIALWSAVAVLAVLIRGIRWDETLEHGQVLAGAVLYPAGHPLPTYLSDAFSVQPYVSAVLWWATASPALLCGFRNALFMLCSLLPIFLLVRTASGNARWGIAAVAFVLSGALLEFDGSYPIAVWPHTFSNGHIGLGWALVTVWSFAAQRWRIGALLLTLMPMVHIGHMPPVLMFAAITILAAFRRGEHKLLINAAPFAIAGALCTLVFLLGIQMHQVPHSNAIMESEGNGGATSIWQGYTLRFDGHRQAPPVNAHLGMGLSVLLAFGLFICDTRTGEQNRYLRHLGVYALLVPAIVWSILAVHSILGSDVPFILIGWMPYRLVNHAPFVAVALAIGALLRVEKDGEESNGGVLIIGILALLTVSASGVLGSISSLQRFLDPGAWVLFSLAGLAFGHLEGHSGGKRVYLMLTLFVSAVVPLSAIHQFGTFCFVVASFIGWIRVGFPHLYTVNLKQVAVPLSAIIIVLLMYRQWTTRESLPVPAYRADIVEYLESTGNEDAVLISEPYEYSLQAHTGHAVLVDSATPSLMSYMPALAPRINNMYRDWYGIDFRLDAGGAAPDWRDVWTRRAAKDWQSLGERYAVDYVVAPAELRLPLPLALETDSHRLYRIAPLATNDSG